MPIFLANEDGSYTPARTSSSARLVVLSDDLHPDAIGAELGLVPDRWWLRGELESHPPDRRWRRSRPHPHHGFEFGSRLAESAPAEEHVRDLLDRIGPAATQVSTLVADPRIHSVRVWLGHHTDNENPGFSLTHSLLERLITLGTGLEMDIYALVEPDVASE